MKKDTMEIVKAVEKDCLMGRGKQISEWAGNVYFRQVVNRFRNEYVNSARDLKVAIANRVIDIVHKNGGRFLQESEGGSGKFYQISHARAIEKCCQALREKEKSNPPEGDPFENLSKKRTFLARGCNLPTKKAKQTSPSATVASKKVKKSSQSAPVALQLPLKKPKQKGTRRKAVQPSPEDVGDKKQSRISPLRSILSQKGEPGVKVTEKKKEKKIVVHSSSKNIDIFSLMESPMDRLKRLSTEEMLRRLDRFIGEHRHTAVPPGWSVDPDLADWCTIQRQRLRMAKKGYKELDREENTLIMKLSSLNFVWDYDEKHTDLDMKNDTK